MVKIKGNFLVFAIILLVFLPSVAAVYRLRDAERPVLCRRAAPEDIMRGEDAPGKPRIFLIPGDMVDINSASEKELALLPGVGEVIAGRIVELREEKGGFTDTAQLLEIEGIGKESFENLETMVFVGEAK